jgi:hypothetical protein
MGFNEAATIKPTKAHFPTTYKLNGRGVRGIGTFEKINYKLARHFTTKSKTVSAVLFMVIKEKKAVIISGVARRIKNA